MLLLGVHADEDDAARDRSSSRRHATPGGRTARELDAGGVFAWRDVVAERDDPSQVEWLEGQRCELVRGDARGRAPGCSGPTSASCTTTGS